MSHTENKLRRRMESTDDFLTEELLRDDGYDYEVVEKRLDKFLKAANEYWSYCFAEKFGTVAQNGRADL